MTLHKDSERTELPLKVSNVISVAPIGWHLGDHREENPKVVVDAAIRGDEWVFSVTDNGEGVPPDMIKDIFEPFRRLHGKDEIPGSALGLSICKRVVEPPWRSNLD